MAKRTDIRTYLHERLIADVPDVAERVYLNRSGSPLDIAQLPAIYLTLQQETMTVITGGPYRAKELRVDLAVTVSVVVEDIAAGSQQLDVSTAGLDYLDYLCEQVENSFFRDYKMQNLLPAGETALAMGFVYNDATNYDSTVGGDRRVIVRDMNWTIPYQKHCYTDKRLNDFKTYKADIIRVNSDASTVDRVLISASGEF